MSAGRAWGIGLLPLGWASFVPENAGDYADRYVDGRMDPAFAAFVPLADALASSSGDFAEEQALIEQHMARLFAKQLRPDPASRP